MNVVKTQPFFLSGFLIVIFKFGKLEINGLPDCRIQKVDSYTGRYRDMYLCDNEMQLMTAMEDRLYLLVGPRWCSCLCERLGIVSKLPVW